MNPSSIVTMRKVSGFQLSIATGLAMETVFAPRQAVFDKDRVAPPRVALKDYDNLYVNVDTLLRNLINACDYSDARQLRPEMIADALIEEVELIQSLASNEGKGLINPVFYLTNYANFYRKASSEYQLRTPTGDKQKSVFYSFIQGRAAALQRGLSVVFSGEEIRPTLPTERALFLTHITPDLLSYRNFAKMELLESHTGKIKTRREWNTKYFPMGEEKFANMPWCKPLLCYLGDRYVLAPLTITFRRKILELSKKQRWSPMTQPSTVYNDCLSKITEPHILKVLREISLY